VTGCTIKTELGTTTANADVRIVNHTSHPASYLVTVGLNNAHGTGSAWPLQHPTTYRPAGP
jgi:hypothetical protein